VLPVFPFPVSSFPPPLKIYLNFAHQPKRIPLFTTLHLTTAEPATHWMDFPAAPHCSASHIAKKPDHDD
jgi:hypothetical protein